MPTIRSVFDFNRELVNGAYAWPGGYPRFMVCADGECLCWKCGTANARLIRDAIIGNAEDDWQVVAVDVNWEHDEQCTNCGGAIESAYGDNNEHN